MTLKEIIQGCIIAEVAGIFLTVVVIAVVVPQVPAFLALMLRTLVDLGQAAHFEV
jgi:hypothetical protein